jgi:DNA-binding NtrC family response regulator
MTEKKILLVEDDNIMRVTLEDVLQSEGYDVESVGDGKGAIEIIENNKFDIVLTDIILPKINGIDVLKAIKKVSPDTTVVMMTAYGSIKDAVESMKLGAYDYITKPFLMEELLINLKKIIDYQNLKEENIRLKKDLEKCYLYSDIIGKSESMQEIFSLIKKIADTDSTVLIRGETGTGKELIAMAIHYNSKRKDYPLIKVNCAALPSTLLESELFGYEKGAFTGAIRKKSGRFELANRGTIFLDEIGDIPTEIQAKLLRILQEKEFERIGGINTIKVDVRIIAATNQNLEQKITEGSFREDLYYRLNVISIEVPPLRERLEDIPPLVEHFLSQFNEKFGKKISISKDAMDALMKYDFPGNVRELGNIIERAVILSSNDIITAKDLSLKRESSNTPSLSLREYLLKVEKDYILKALNMFSGNKTLTAEFLGISRKTLWEKLKDTVQ